MGKINKILIANRGEIACRIMRTCQAMGISTIAVYSEADRDALHVATADRAFEIGPPPVTRSYLDSDAILRAAALGGADAIHPGYGLLAENAGFARAVETAGHVWIGPDPETIEAMGDKHRARDIARASGIPVLPGSARLVPGDDIDPEGLAASVGLPLLVKAAGGGGGIGMRVVSAAADLGAQIEATQKLAERTFSDSSVYLEHHVANARHIEVQVFGFGDGGGIHLFDRDCSIQRRFQKIIEEAPAPALVDTLRRQLRDAALKLVRRQRYRGAGTVEFIYDRDRELFYFLEMNTRIQVEHTVTEMITGIDLVRCQIELAAGSYTAPGQAEFACSGHALECRLYAERPEKNFLPSPGRLTRLSFPAPTDTVRIDTGLREGDSITPYYDPLIAKLIVAGPNREIALSRMRKALSETHIEGIRTNLMFLQEVLADHHFQDAAMSTRYVENRRQMVAGRERLRG